MATEFSRPHPSSMAPTSEEIVEVLKTMTYIDHG
jgi:hypothetical protein